MRTMNFLTLELFFGQPIVIQIVLISIYAELSIFLHLLECLDKNIFLRLITSSHAKYLNTLVI